MSEMSRYSFRAVDANSSLPSIGVTPPAQQAFFYGTWHERVERKVFRHVIERDGNAVGALQLIAFPLTRGYSLLYAPYGPVLADTSGELLGALANYLGELAANEKAIFVRIDPTTVSPVAHGALQRAGFSRPHNSTRHASAFQPAYEWLLDITASEDALYAGMDKKHRYSLRIAEEQHVATTIYTKEAPQHLDIFMTLMEDTARRDGFSLHPRAYYEAAFASLSGGHGYLAVATVAGAPVVINVVICEGDTAHLFFSGSSTAHRHTMASYAAQWAAIRHAKTMGMRTYNFGGVSGPGDERYENITRYKKRFGGHLLAHEHTADLVQYRILYELYALRRIFTS